MHGAKHKRTHARCRSALEDARAQHPKTACSLASLLRGLPRHLQLPVFSAYCEWAASYTKEQGEPFSSLSAAGPPTMEPFLLQLLGLPPEQATSIQVGARARVRVESAEACALEHAFCTPSWKEACRLSAY